jgi:four helix bundle protein
VGHRDLRVFRRAYALAQEIFELSRGLPREERFALTDQIRRSSRSVAANIAEAFRRARYPRLLAQRLTDADAEATETQVWIDFATDCGYVARERSDELRRGYEEIGRILGSVLSDPARYVPKR